MSKLNGCYCKQILKTIRKHATKWAQNPDTVASTALQSHCQWVSPYPTQNVSLQASKTIILPKTRAILTYPYLKY